VSAVLPRRKALLGASIAIAAAAATTGCKKSPRCKRCGMKLDPASAWRAELVTPTGVVAFDTPRCALTSWRTGQTPATAIRVQEYYERVTRDGADVRFAVGGDVVGPMGPDFVPIDPARASKFIQDHGAERVLRLDEMDRAFLDAN